MAERKTYSVSDRKRPHVTDAFAHGTYWFARSGIWRLGAPMLCVYALGIPAFFLWATARERRGKQCRALRRARTRRSWSRHAASLRARPAAVRHQAAMENSPSAMAKQ